MYSNPGPLFGHFGRIFHRPVHGRQGLFSLPDRLQQLLQRRCRDLDRRQRTEVEVPGADHITARLHGGHLAVPHHQPSRAAEALLDLGDGRYVERIIGGVPRDHRADQGHDQRIQGGDRHLDLGQVGPLVLAVAELEQASPVVRGGVLAVVVSTRTV